MLSKLDDVDFSKLRDNNFKDFIVENELADKSLVKFLEDVDIEEKTLESYQQYLIKTGKSTSDFTSFTKKAGTTLKSLGAAMASMAVNWAIGKIIDLAVTAWDHFNLTVKEVQENIDNLTSNIESLNTELNELNSKSNLSDAEQKRLNYLETRIDLEERLLKIEQTRLAQEQLGKPSKITDWFDEDSYVQKASLEFGEDAVKRPMSALGVLFPGINNLINLIPLMNNISAYFNGSEAVIKKGNKQYEKLEYLNNKYEQLVKKRDAFKVGSHDWQIGDERVARIASELEAYQKQVASGSYADLLEKYGQYTKEIENLEGILENSDYLSAYEITYSQKLLGLYSSTAEEMKELINNIAISLGDQSLWVGTDLELLDSKTDILTADAIQSNFTDEEIKVLAYLDFDRNASINTLRSLLKEEQAVADDEPIKLSNVLSTDSLDKFQSSIKSAADAYTTLLSGNYSSSELLDSIQSINKAASDMGKSIDWESIAASDNPLQAIQDEIESISNTYAESVLSGAGINTNSDFGKMLANIVQQAYEAEAEFAGMNAQLDRLQSSYKTLTDVLESYNETGHISLDNLQSLLTADENLITMLEVENGQLVINQAAYENLIATQLLEFKAKLNDAAAAEIEVLAKNKSKEATNNNAKASEDAVAKLDAETQALKRNTEAAGENAITKAIANAEEAGVSEEEIQSVLDKYAEIWNAAMDNYGTDFPAFMNGAKSSGEAAGKSAGEAFTDTLDKELTALDKKMEAGYIDFKDYIQARLDLIEDYYKQGKLSADEYYSYLEKHYKQELSYRDKAVSAVTKRIDAELDALKQQKDDVESIYKTQIESLEKEKTLLEEANKERQRQIDLQKSLYDLERARNQRTKLVYFMPDAIVI